MAWTYLAESEGSALHSSRGLKPEFTVKSTHTVEECFSRGWQTGLWIVDQSGTTSKPSTFERREMEAYPSLILFTEASLDLARTSVLRDLEQAWMESEADFSLKSQDLCVSFDPDSFSWRMSQQSLFGGLTEFCWSSLRWGMIVDGQLSQPRKLEPAISEKDGSCCLPTPMAREGGTNKSASPGAKIRPQLATIAKTLPTPMARDWKQSGGTRNSWDLPRTMDGTLNPQFVEEIMGYKIGWTECDPWAIPLSRCKPGKRLCD